MSGPASLSASGTPKGAVEQNVPAYERRLSSLESKVYGQNEPRAAKQKFSCLDRLVSIDSRMKGATKANREHIRTAWTQLAELDQWMNVVMSQTISDSAKSDAILAQESAILDTAGNLSAVSELKNVVNSEPLTVVGDLSSKLKPLVPVHLEQVQRCGDIQEDVRCLSESYNQALGLLSEQFVALANVVSELERRKQDKCK